VTGCHQNLLLNLRWLRPGVMDPLTAGPANGWNWTVINNCEELIMIQTLFPCIELNHVTIVSSCWVVIGHLVKVLSFRGSWVVLTNFIHTKGDVIWIERAWAELVEC
jgi:hypothetical protein